MIAVEGYAAGTTVTFRDCIVDVRGNFFSSKYPVNLIFDNCQFRVSQTVNLLNLDYSNNALCPITAADLTSGDLMITNSQFSDTLSTFSGNKTLFNIKTMFDVNFSRVTF